MNGEAPDRGAQHGPTRDRSRARTVVVGPQDHPLAEVVRVVVQEATDRFDAAGGRGVVERRVQELLDECEAGPSLVVADIMDGDDPVHVHIRKQP